MTAILSRYEVQTFPQLILKLGSRLLPREGALTLLLTMFLLLSVVWSVEAAGWVERLPNLGLVLVLGTLLSFLLAKTRMWWWMALPVGLLYGFVVTAWQATTLIDKPELSDRVVDLVVRLNAWGYTVRTGGFSADNLVFIFWVIAGTWLIAIASTWLVFRMHAVWAALLLPAVAILFNLRFAPAGATVWFFFFLVFALLLLVRFNVYRQHENWKRRNFRVGDNIGVSSLPEMTVFSFAIAGVIWFAPGIGFAPVISTVWETVTQPVNDTMVELNRLFSNLRTENEAPSTTFSRSLLLKGPIKLGTAVLMQVVADQPVYLRATTYDTYTSGGFQTGEKETVQFPAGSDSPTPTKSFKSTQTATIKVTLRATPGNSLLAPGAPNTASQRAVADVDRMPSYVVSVDDPSGDSALPADLRARVDSLRAAIVKAKAENRLGNGPSEAPTEITSLLPSEVRVFSYLSRDGAVAAVELRRFSAYPPDFTSIRVPRGKVNANYSVQSMLSFASEAELRGAGTGHPGYISDRYLQLTPTVPDRVRRLAREITAGANNDYDRAIRLQDYLRQFRYNESIAAPPPGSDPLDHFLFTMKEGYCDYFASAMVVMLRSLGVPSRIAAGYYTGEFDSNRAMYLVRESNTHAWPEVYFPEYGWIEFEPTPSRPTFARGSGSTLTTADGGTGSTGGEALPDDGLLIDEDLGFDASGAGVSDSGTGGAWGGVLLLLAVAAAAGWYVWNRGLRRLALAPATFERVRRLAWLAYRPQRPAETPMEYGRSLAAELPSHAASVERVVEGYTVERYSKRGLAPGEGSRLRRAWEDLRLPLLRLAAVRGIRSIFGARLR